MITKEKIYIEAARLFQEKGYSATSIRDLAGRLNLQPSSLYSHIRSKEDLLERICFDNAWRYRQLMEDCQAMDVSAAQKVEYLLRNHIRMALNYPTSVTVFNDEWRHLPPKRLQEFISMRKDYERAFCHLLEEAMERGDFRAFPPHLVLNVLLSGLRWLHRLERGEDMPNEDALIDLLLRGILRIKH